MADANYIDRTAETKIVGQDSTGTGVNYVSATTNGDLQATDVANTSCVYKNVSVTTSASELKVGVSRLTARKMIVIEPLGGDIYFGYDSSITTSNGILLKKGQIMALPIGATISVYAICASGTQDTRIQELA